MTKMAGLSPDEIDFAAVMKSLRTEQRITQKYMAQVLKNAGWTGMSQATIWSIEDGRRKVRLGEATAIAALLNTTIQDMLAEPDYRFNSAKEVSQNGA